MLPAHADLTQKLNVILHMLLSRIGLASNCPLFKGIVILALFSYKATQPQLARLAQIRVHGP
jgi:hypothetical protein